MSEDTQQIPPANKTFKSCHDLLTDRVKRRFWKYVKKSRGCWEWIGANADGYGVFGIGYKMYKSHRVSYEIHFGKLVSHLRVCHECDNPSCVRPDHLFLGTQQANIHDCIRKGRRHNPSGDAHHRSTFSTEEVLLMRELSEHGIPVPLLAGFFESPYSTIDKVVRGISWKHLLPKS